MMKYARQRQQFGPTGTALTFVPTIRPWHVFVDTSPGTGADFEVAGTFDNEPTQDELNVAIVECLEGSEREDEIVAYQMQEALETGQLDRISDMIGKALDSYSEITDDDDADFDVDFDEEDDDAGFDEEDDDADFDMFEEDSV
jgi:hypothetical protein